MSFNSINLGLRELLRDPARRHEFFRAMTQDDIASQIRDLRKERSLTQVAFAKRADMKQSAVSRIEQAEYSSWTLTTLFRAAAALDARLRVTFQPMEDAIKEYESLEDNEDGLIPGERNNAVKAFNDGYGEQKPLDLSGRRPKAKSVLDGAERPGQNKRTDDQNKGTNPFIIGRRASAA